MPCKNCGTQRPEPLLAELDQRFAWLAKQPKLGKPRPDIADGYFCFPQGAHLIFYLRSSNGIDIIGIPHQRWTSRINSVTKMTFNIGPRPITLIHPVKEV
ncbi:type II toxin-antitoxin system RelE/ParE family toxin [Methylomonas koyamae]|uniref:type II toxin-antitoxin system RelE/ParE family toxin n=1 Tax=Methylomonas koyamae TaxID=702114 RepID=UPI0035C0DC96